MHCEDVQQRIEEFVDGELALAEKQAVDKHLRTCQACSNVVALRNQLRQATLEAFAVKAPQKVRFEIDRRAAKTARRSVRPRLMVVALATAATALMAIGIAVQHRNRSPKPAPFGHPAPVIVIGAVEEPSTPGRLVLPGRL